MVSRFKFFLLIFFLSAAAVHAQQNPVNVNVNVVPPYSMYLSDYMQGSNKVVVTLVNQSMSETQRFKLGNRPVWLQKYLECFLLIDFFLFLSISFIAVLVSL